MAFFGVGYYVVVGGGVEYVKGGSGVGVESEAGDVSGGWAIDEVGP